MGGVRQSKQGRFIVAYIACMGNVTKACDEVSISRDTFYRWRRSDSFKEKLEETTFAFVDELKAEAIQRAMNGSDGLLKFLLESFMTETFDTGTRRSVAEKSLPNKSFSLAPIVVEGTGFSIADRIAMAEEAGSSTPGNRERR